MPHLVDFIGKALDGPQRARTGFVRFAATKLVIEDHWAIIAEGLQRFEIVMSCARSAVQESREGSLA